MDNAMHKKHHLNWKVPDGGWGWMIVLGTTIIMVLSSNIHLSYGVMFSMWYNEHDVSSTLIGIIFNVNAFLFNLMFLLIGPLTEEFGWRRVGMLSNFMIALAIILSSFASSITHLVFSYSILGGIFGGLSVAQVHTILPKFFDKRLGLANAFPMAAYPLCQFIFPVLIPYLQDQFGFKGSMLLLGGIMLNSVAAAALFQPPGWHRVILQREDIGISSLKQNNIEASDLSKNCIEVSCITENSNEVIAENIVQIGSITESNIVAKDLKENKTGVSVHPKNGLTEKKIKVSHQTEKIDLIMKYIKQNHVVSGEKNLAKKVSATVVCVLKSAGRNLTILKEPTALILSLSFSVFLSSTMNFNAFVPFIIINKGYSLEDAGLVLSYGAIANVLARFSSNTLSDFAWFKIPFVYGCGTLLSLISIVGFAFADNIIWLSIFFVLQSFGYGMHMGLYSLVTKETVGLDRHSASIGSSGSILSIGFLILGTLVGYIKDVFGSYTVTLIFIALLNALSLFLWILMPYAKSYELKNSPKKTDEYHNESFAM